MNFNYYATGNKIPSIDQRVRVLEQYPGAVVVTPPVIGGSSSIPIGIPFSIEISSSSLLVDGQINKFEYQIDDGEVQSVLAVGNRATISIEIASGTPAGTQFTLTVIAYDNYGSRNFSTKTFTTIFAGISTPTIAGKTTNVVKGQATFTGSPFNPIGLEGTHGKSDWVLSKEAFPTVEVWSSKNDSTNLTNCPSSINNALESGVTYILKLRYYDETNSIWSDWGSITFTMAVIAVHTPTISGKTEDVISSSATFTGSAFQVSGATGSHDKSDWVLYNSSSSEIWASRNDSVNKTTSPTNLNDVLEVSTNYIIKVRYHDSVNDIWSDWGQLAFTTADRFLRYNHIGVAGTGSFGVGVAQEAEYSSLGLTPCSNCTTENHFEYGLYTKTISISTTAGESLSTPCYFKYIPKFYIKYLQKDDVGTNLTDEELDATLPYVDVTKEQMKEAQRRSPFNAMVVASADKFADRNEAQTQGFILPRGFIDGGEEKNGVFILNSLVSGTGNGTKLTSLSFGVPSTSVASTLVPLSLHNNSSVDTHLISNMQGNSYDAVSISKLVGDEFNCCSIFVWSITCLLSLIQGQYATNTSECAWYDSEGTINFPKGINSNDKDYNDSSVTATVGSDSKTIGKPNTVVLTEYAKTTHNGSITGITNVSGWVYQFCTGFGYQNSAYSYLDISHKISEITSSNMNTICDVSLGTKLDSAGFATSVTRWGSTTKSSFSRDFSGKKWAMNGVYSYANDSSGTNELGTDYHSWGAYSGIQVGGSWKTASNAGVLYRGNDSWESAYSSYGFRIIAYPV